MNSPNECLQLIAFVLNEQRIFAPEILKRLLHKVFLQGLVDPAVYHDAVRVLATY